MPSRNIFGIGAPGMGPLPQAGWTTPVPPLNDQHVLEVVNTSAGTLAHGDLVIVDTSAAANATTGWIPFPAVAAPPISPQAAGVAVTTSTTANDKRVLGPISQTGDAGSFSGSTIAIGANAWVVVAGIARVQIGAQVVVANDTLYQSGTAKQAISQTAATVTAAAGTYLGASCGVALEATAAKDAQNTVRAIIGRF